MRYKQATLFRTPLKSDLSEVFDGFTSKQNYLQFLRGAYPNNYQVNSQIDFPLRAIKTRDLDTTLVIPMSNEIIGSQKYYKDFNPLDWNYCAITYQYYDYASTSQDHLVNDVKFYFITGAESLNDDPKRGTCKLYLTEDCWANYYLDFAGSNDLHRQFMHRSTQKAIIGSNVYNFGAPPSLRPISKSFYYFYDDVILSLGLRFQREKIKSVSWNGSSLDTLKWGSDFHQAQTPIFYIPITDLGRDNQNGVFVDSDDNQMTQNFFSNNSYFIPEVANSIYCIDAWLTCCGVDATFSRTSANTNYYNVINNGKVVTVTFEDDTTAQMVIAPNFSKTQTRPASNAFTPPSTISTNIEQIIEGNECFNTYPFRSISASINGIEIPTNIYRSGSITITTLREGSSTAKCWYSIGGNTSKRFLLENNFKVVRVNDSLEIMLNNNANQIEIAKTKAYSNYWKGGLSAALAAGALTLATGPLGIIAGIGGIVGGGFGVAGGLIDLNSIDAQIADADSQLDTVSIPSMSGSDAIYFDTPYYILGGIFDVDTRQRYYGDLQYKGFYFDSTEYLTVNHKEIFDYSQTLECSIPQVKNPLARERLEQAYNRGITRFHIKTVDDELYDYVINMEKDVTNRSV